MMRMADIPALTMTLAVAAGCGALSLLGVLLPSIVIAGGEGSRTSMARLVVALPQDDARPFEAYAAIQDRPLFNPQRQKDPVLPPQGARSALPPLSEYRLVGLVMMKDVRFGLVERRSTKQVVTLRPGDDFEGRHVDAIKEGGVVFSGAGTAELLAMPKVGGITRERARGTPDRR